MRFLLALAPLMMLSNAGAWAKEAAPNQNLAPDSATNSQPLGGGKPVTTTIIKRCADGRELVLRVNGTYGCAKDVVPLND